MKKYVQVEVKKVMNKGLVPVCYYMNGNEAIMADRTYQTYKGNVIYKTRDGMYVIADKENEFDAISNEQESYAYIALNMKGITASLEKATNTVSKNVYCNLFR